MAEQSSIIGIKQTFLHTQIRTLNATLEPSLVPGENGEVRKELLKEVWQKRMRYEDCPIKLVCSTVSCFSVLIHFTWKHSEFYITLSQLRCVLVASYSSCC